MKLRFCALCGKEFGTPGVVDSREHIIPNSLGGQKKVTGIICDACNNRTGLDWDAVLADQLSFVSVLTNAKRDRGEQPCFEAKTQSGKTVRVHADGHLARWDDYSIVWQSKAIQRPGNSSATWNISQLSGI